MRSWTPVILLAALGSGCRCDSEEAPVGAPSTSTATVPPGRWIDLALGDEHGCAVRRDGAVYCWGRVPAGAGFDGIATLTPRPASIPAAERVVAASRATCTLGGGEVRCWGEVAEGLRWEEPTTVAGLSGATDLALGREHLCGVVGGRVRCLGANAHGQLGDGTTTARRGVVDVVGLDGVTALVAGDTFTCGHRTELTVFCWGRGELGQLGHGHLEGSAIPVGVEGLTEVGFVDAAENTACAGRDEGRTVVCWGAQAGDLIDDRRITESRQILQNGVRDLAGVALSGTTACGWREDGSVVCWGDGRGGLLGDAGRTDRGERPARLEALAGVTAIDAAPTAMCAIVDAGEGVSCWGSADHGLLGNGTRRRHGRVKVAVSDARAIEVGDGWSCALVADGDLRCWGRGTLRSAKRERAPWTVGRANAVASLGPTIGVLGPAAELVTPRGAREAWSGSWTALSGDGARFEGVDDRGRLFALSRPGDGEPTLVDGLPPLADVVVSGPRSCARTRGGEVICYEAAGDEAQPQTVPDATGATDLAYAAGRGLVLVEGEARAFRFAAGDDTPRSRNSTVAAGGVVDVAVGGPLGGTDCVVRNDGRLDCAGALAPPGTVDDAQEVALGQTHGCVRHRDGTVSCWGDDAFGQVGSPTPAFALTPVPAQLP